MNAQTELALPNAWTKDRIKNLLETSDVAVCRALLVLHNRQTSDEQQAQETRHVNSRGFSAFDAEILSSFAVQYRTRGTLSSKQLEIARRKVLRYTRQLTEEANINAARAARRNDE